MNILGLVSYKNAFLATLSFGHRRQIERTKDVQKTSRTSSEGLKYVQLTTCRSSHRISVRRCSYKFRKIHRKTPAQKACNFALLWIFAKFLRPPFFTEYLWATASRPLDRGYFSSLKSHWKKNVFKRILP